jgi:hypothetical protein
MRRDEAFGHQYSRHSIFSKDKFYRILDSSVRCRRERMLLKAWTSAAASNLPRQVL